jgi:hypothetical protein
MIRNYLLVIALLVSCTTEKQSYSRKSIIIADVEEICEQWENETIVAMNNRLRTTENFYPTISMLIEAIAGQMIPPHYNVNSCET